jgi:arylsulfatase A-like enzyme
LRWLSRRDTQRPFFAFLNYWDAHSPYLPPQPFDTMYGPLTNRRNPRLNPNWQWTPEEIKVEEKAYDSCIAYIDYQLGMLFDELNRRGVLDNTLVIVASDHGEEFGEHGLMFHGYSLYVPSLHVPLLMVFPRRIPAGTIVSTPVTLRDLPATVLDLLQLGSGPFPGKTVARYWNGAANPADPEIEVLLAEVNNSANDLPANYPIKKGDMKSLIISKDQYILNGDHREELYDWEADVWEQQDLAGTQEGRQATTQSRQFLAALLAHS